MPVLRETVRSPGPPAGKLRQTRTVTTGFRALEGQKEVYQELIQVQVQGELLSRMEKVFRSSGKSERRFHQAH